MARASNIIIFSTLAQDSYSSLLLFLLWDSSV